MILHYIITITEKIFLVHLKHLFHPRIKRIESEKYKISFLSRRKLDSLEATFADGLAARFILRKRVNSKRNVAHWIELFHAIVVVFSNGRIEATDGSKGEWWWGREGESKRTRNKRRTIRRFIPPATAYAFIIIHEIPRRRFCELPSALRTGLKRLIEKREREGGKGGEGGLEEGSLPKRKYIVETKARWASRRMSKGRKRSDEERVEGRIKRMRARRGEGRGPGSRR